MYVEAFMRKAIAWAHKGKATSGGGPFGAVIVHSQTIIAQGHNLVKETTDCTQHAELAMIQQACKKLGTQDLSECILYTSCEPCMMCLGASYWAGFKAIYYGASAQDAKQYGFVYSTMFYASDVKARHKEFNLVQKLRDEALAVWQ